MRFCDICHNIVPSALVFQEVQEDGQPITVCNTCYLGYCNIIKPQMDDDRLERMFHILADANSMGITLAVAQHEMIRRKLN